MFYFYSQKHYYATSYKNKKQIVPHKQIICLEKLRMIQKKYSKYKKFDNLLL